MITTSTLGEPVDHGLVHLGGPTHANDGADRRWVDGRGPGDERHLGAAAGGFRGNREAHATARSVADEPDRIDVFERGPGGHQHALPAQGTRRPQDGVGGRHDLLRFGQASLADPSAGEVPLARLDKSHAAGGQRIQIAADRVVLEHLRVHGRRDEDGSAGGRVERGQKIVGDSVGELADDVRRGRRDEQQIDRRGQRDVLDVGVGARLELVGDDAPARDGFERDRPHEARRRRRHDGDDIVTAGLQTARDFDRLVGADAAGNAERDQHRHWVIGHWAIDG